jgi:hypothetical protein
MSVVFDQGAVAGALVGADGLPLPALLAGTPPPGPSIWLKVRLAKSLLNEILADVS